MKHRGVYWKKQSEKFVVSFKSNGKAKTYGLFASFEDAVKRAEEVWPTLPIANRSQRVCDNCCVRISNQLFDWGKSTCKACRRTQKRTLQTPKRKCKTCGCDFVSKDKRQVVCSRECGHKGRSKGKVKYSCCVCGKQVDRYVRQQEKQAFVACGAACQKVIAGRAGKDNVRASIRAKTRWYKKRSAERRAANKWWKLCCSGFMTNKTQEDEWRRRCANAVTCMAMRAEPKETQLKDSKCDSWECSIKQQTARLRCEKKQSRLSPWKRKVLNAISSLAKRQRRRAKKQMQSS